MLALAWVTEHPEPGLIRYYKNKLEQLGHAGMDDPKVPRVRIPGTTTHYQTITGRTILIPADRLIELSEEELIPALQSGAIRV